MKQIVQNINDGSLGTLLINASSSIISPGNEGMLKELGKSNWPKRKVQHIHKARMVRKKVDVGSLSPIIEAVWSKFD